MGADTTYYVTVKVLTEETREVRAVTGDDAREQAEKLPGVVSVERVQHWNEYAEEKAE